MNENIQKAKDLMEMGRKAYEDVNFDEAEQFLGQAKEIFESENDWFNVSECLNHLAYTKKLRSQQLINEGYKLAQESLNLAKEKGTKEVLANRALLSVTDSMGFYEEAKIYANSALEQFGNIADKADILSHLATLELRTGDKDKARELITQAEKLLEDTWDESKAPHIYIWKTRVLMAKALIEYSFGDLSTAVNLTGEALKISQEKQLKSRILQAERLLTFFSNHNIS